MSHGALYRIDASSVSSLTGILYQSRQTTGLLMKDCLLSILIQPQLLEFTTLSSSDTYKKQCL